MDLTRDQIIDAVQALPPADQIAVADAIYMTTRAPWMEEDMALSSEWDKEIAKRLREIDEGKVELIPWEQVEAEMREILRGSDQS